MTNEEIQVGEYVRTTSGFIAKCIEKNEYNLEFDDSIRKSYSELWSHLYPNENDVLKHSFNLIDLIEKGDYVNGDKVVDVGGAWKDNLETITIIECKSLGEIANSEEIKSVVTHEQFEQAEYKVGEESD